MRLTTPLKTVLAGSAALALLTACGGGSDDDASTSSATTSSAAASSAEQSGDATDPEAAAFCADAEAAFGELESIAETTDPSALPAIFAQASERLGAIEPPSEIADSWGTLTGALDQAVQSVQGLDLNTPEGQQAFTEAFSALETTGSAAQEEVGAYVDANCDLPTESASATS